MPFRCLSGVLWAPLDALWAPLVTTWATLSTQGWKLGVRAGHKSNLGCHLGSIWESFFQPKGYVFSEEWLPKTSPQSRAICVRFLCLDFWALASTGAQFSKNYLDSWKLQKSSPKWSKISAQRLQNGIRRHKNGVWKSTPKKASKTRAQQWVHMLIGTSPLPSWDGWGECPSGGHFSKDSLHMGSGSQPICSSFGLKAAISSFSHSLCL